MTVKLWRLGLTSFDTASKVQQAISRKHLDAMAKGLDTKCFDTLLLVEHNPVYTVGIRDNSPLAEIMRLKNLGAEFKKTNRGGLITFHGPGQLVAYPILNLKHFRTSVKWFVKSLEETAIRMCADLGLSAERSEHTGVWIDDNKLAAIGIHASRYVTSHGIAINCNNDLSWFKHITPCGIEDKGVTSLSEELAVKCTVEEMTPLFLKNFEKVFDCTLGDVDEKFQEEILSGIYTSLITETTAFAAKAEV